MASPLLTLLQNLPFGLLLAALLLDYFIILKNRREVEPAVLWLLFCSVCASGLVVVVTLAIFFIKGDSSRLHEGFWGLVVAAVASLAWMFKRGGRNRGVLLLRERFYGADPREAPRPRPGQYFWILGWRVLAIAALAAGAAHLLGIKPGVPLSKYDQGPIAQTDANKPATPPEGTPAATPAAPSDTAAPPAPTPAVASADTTTTPTPAPAPTPALTPDETNPAPPATPVAAANPDSDPTKSELPTAADSAAAEKMVSGTPDPAAAGTPVVTPPPAAPPAEPARPISRNSSYFSKIRPIFAKACVKCHGAEKQKGDLALHNPDAIRAGINGKPCIVPGDPDKSRVYKCITLPPDDPDFMPQKGQPLSMSDKKLIHDWIKAGADLGDGVTIPGGGGGVFVVDNIAANLPEPDQKVIEALEKDHVIVRRLSKNKRVIEIDFSHSDRMYSDLKLAELAPLALHIYALDFNKTRIKDADLAHLAGMKNLSKLILSRTDIGDAGLINLRPLTTLEQLNLYGTLVTDAGLIHLEPLKALKNLFVYQSKVTDAGAKQITAAIPGLVVNQGTTEPPPPRPGMQPNQRNNN